MKKQLHILEGLIILLIILISIFFSVQFVYQIKHEQVDTSYMWNIDFHNIKVKEGSKPSTLSMSDNKIYLNISLENPDEFYEFTIDITNNGSLDAKISNIIQNVDSDNDILTYNLSYSDDTSLQIGDILPSSHTTTIKVRITYPKTETQATDILSLKLDIKIDYTTF